MKNGMMFKLLSALRTLPARASSSAGLFMIEAILVVQ
jgi:hypothetical protein